MNQNRQTQGFDGQNDLIDAAYVELMMERAGRTLMMLQVRGCWPAGYRSCNPEVVRSFSDFIGVEPDGEMPKMRANAKQVSEFEEVMGWIQMLALYCRNKNMIYVARAVCHALPRKVMDGKRCNSWRSIGKRFGGRDHKTVKSWYDDGVSIIVKLVNEKKVAEQSRGNS